MIYEILADGFEEIEAVAPADILRRGGKEVMLTGLAKKTAVGSHGIEFICDINIDEIDKNNIEMVILPGGMPGTLNLKESNKVKELLDYCTNNSIYIGAICAAPSILGKFGYLAGKSATCFPGFEDELTGASVLPDRVVKDGNIITSRGAGTALDFGFSLLSVFNKEKADKLYTEMQCK